VNERVDEPSETSSLQRGLRMAAPPDPESLRREAAWLDQLERGPWTSRIRGYLSLSGPGYLQSALTLGAGTATASLFSGAVFGYQLLWVAPASMALGVIALAAVAHQTLSTGLRPLPAMRKFAGAPFAIAWAASSLLASIVWHVPQYNLAANSVVDLCAVFGLEGLPPISASPLLLLAAVWLSWSYGRSPTLVRRYETFCKLLIWATVASLVWVVANTHTDWAAVVAGFWPSIPADRDGHSAFGMVASGLAAAVGVNMTFLYPYSLMARGWGRSHRGLARCDLVCGMLLPYGLATSLMTIAAANTLHGGDPVGKGAAIGEVSRVLGTVLGATLGRVVFDLGMLAMAFSTISLHMLVCGFVATEWFGCEVGSRRHRMWQLLPAPAAIAPWLFSAVPVWIAVPTNIACGALLPLTYFAFWKLHRSRAYLGDDLPRGIGASLWTLGMWLAVIVPTVAIGLYVKSLT
jgi:manganese transport protein